MKDPHYNFLLIAMSMSEAKSLLGFSDSTTPTVSEIQSAYREKAFKLHPDRGGDHESMVALNVARDLLLGRTRPTYDNRPKTKYEPPKPPKEVKVDFHEAVSKAGVPSGVEWLFTTGWQHGTSWSSDESSRLENYFVAYGKLGDQRIFVGAKHYIKRDFYVGGTANDDIWSAVVVKPTLSNNSDLEPRWLYGNVVKALKDAGFKGRFNSKVLDAKGWKLSSKLPSGNGASIKHWLVNSGQLGSDAPAVSSRKQVVELKLVQQTLEGKNVLELTLNGRTLELTERDAKTMTRILRTIFGTYYYNGSKKVITRLAKRKAILKWILENLKDLPGWAEDVLKAAQEA